MKPLFCLIAALLGLVSPAWALQRHDRSNYFQAVDKFTGIPYLAYLSSTCYKGELGPGDDRYVAELTLYTLAGQVVKTNYETRSDCPTPRREAINLAESLDVEIGGTVPPPPRTAASRLPGPADHRLYLANDTSTGGRSAVEVIDTERLRFLATIDIGDQLVAGLAVAPGGTRVYALLYPSTLGSPKPASILYIDTAANAVTDRLDLPGLSPGTPALSPDGRYLYFAASTAATPARIRAVDLSQKTVAVLPDPVPANTDLRAVALTPDGALLCASGLGSLACYDTRTWTFVGRSAASPPNRDLAPVFHPNGRWVYLLGRSFVNSVLTIYISVINTATLTEFVRIPIVNPTADDFRDSVARLRIDPTGARLILDERVNGVMNIIDTRTNRVIKTVDGLSIGGLGGVIVP